MYLSKNLFTLEKSIRQSNLIRDFLQVRPFSGRFRYQHAVFSSITLMEDVMLLRFRILDFFINFMIFSSCLLISTQKKQRKTMDINEISMKCAGFQSEYDQT